LILSIVQFLFYKCLIHSKGAGIDVHKFKWHFLLSEKVMGTIGQIFAGRKKTYRPNLLLAMRKL